MMKIIHGVEVDGINIDGETRCAHYHSEFDVIAIKFACCNRYFPCHLCHEALADHSIIRRPEKRFEEFCVLCGRCGRLLTATEYLNSSSSCPNCTGAFNPGCALHRHLYFEGDIRADNSSPL